MEPFFYMASMAIKEQEDPGVFAPHIPFLWVEKQIGSNLGSTAAETSSGHKFLLQ